VDARTPQQQLDEAKRIVDAIDESSIQREAAERFADLKRDLNDLATAYRAQKDRSASPTAPGAQNRRPTGTSGSTGTSIPGSAKPGTDDWRMKYTAVENDLRGLIGSGSNVPSGTTTANPQPVSGGVANLDASLRGRLQEVRTHLQMFYAATMGQRGNARPEEKTPPGK
jgi:hypothetical protein